MRMRLELDIRIAVLLFLALSAAPAVRSQVPGLPSANPPAAAKPAEDPFGRDTPRGAVVNFLKTADAGITAGPSISGHKTVGGSH
jgi:hypothetical protein